MTQSTHRIRATQTSAATNARSFRTFLLMSQLQAREIGARIKQKRLERGLTQDELASMASFSARSLQDYENGVTIPYKHFTEIGRLLHARSDWFLYGEEPPAGGEDDRLSLLQTQVAEIREMLDRALASRDEPGDTAPQQQAEDL